jgi:hypothetical protein
VIGEQRSVVKVPGQLGQVWRIPGYSRREFTLEEAVMQWREHDRALLARTNQQPIKNLTTTFHPLYSLNCAPCAHAPREKNNSVGFCQENQPVMMTARVGRRRRCPNEAASGNIP